jgi:hypothetical protein
VISLQASPAAGEDLLFVTPRFSGQGEGVMLMDAGGRLVWLHRVPGRSAAALRPVRYRGSPAMAWWEGAIERGLGDGEFVIVDDRYREQARVRTVRHPADLHELLVTPQGTAYAFAMDLVELDGRLVDDMLVQEVDIATGRLLWEWRASDHIRPEESSEPAPEEGPWDYLHFSSIDRDLDGDLLLSARHTDALYRVSRRTGDIVWRLGGKGSDFELPEDAVFRKQHDARRHEDGTISLFDNATKDPEDTVRPRGLVLRLDEAARTVELVRQLAPPHDIVSSSQGNLSVAADGSATIGWGSANLVTGYDAAGEVVFDAAMPDGFSSYRAYRAPWRGRPADDPVIAVELDDAGTTTAWVSWNGATRVAEWELLAGSGDESLEAIGRGSRDGFESGLPVPEGAEVIAVRALDRRGRPLGASRSTNVAAALAQPRTVS